MGWVQQLGLWGAIFVPSMVIGQATQLLLCGGGIEPTTAIKEFVHRAGDERAQILFIGFSASYPEESGASFRETIESVLLKQNLVQESPMLSPAYDKAGKRIYNEDLEPQFVEELSDTQQKQLLLQLETATAVWLSGGIQDRFMRMMGRYPEIKKALLNFFHSGKIIGGTSAGAAVAAAVMVTASQAKNSFWQMPGMGFIGAVVDQHLFYRDRVERFRASVNEYKNRVRYGIGIDEDGAVLVTNGNRFSVMEGGTDALLIDTRSAKNGQMSEIRLKPGDEFVLPAIE